MLVYPFLTFSFSTLGECLLISLAAGPLPLCLFLSLTSREGAWLGETPLQKDLKTPPVAAMLSLADRVAAGQGLVHM